MVWKRSLLSAVMVGCLTFFVGGWGSCVNGFPCSPLAGEPASIMASTTTTTPAMTTIMDVVRLRAAPATTLFNNGEWMTALQEATLPENPFGVILNGQAYGSTTLLTFASRVTGTNRFPQVFVINASGFLRIKSGADPTPPLPFGQSLVLGPAIFGTSASFPNPRLFFNPQLHTVSIDTTQLNSDGTGSLLIRLVANDSNLPAESTKTNQIMNLVWDITLHEPTETQTQIDVAGQFRFTEAVTPDPIRTGQFQSFRLFQISSLFINGAQHDVDVLRYRDAGGRVELLYAPNLASVLLPENPTALDPATLIFDSLHTDDQGEPNGNTPSYRITGLKTQGPITGSITPRAFFVPTMDVNDDNLGVWLHQNPSDTEIPAGAMGRIEYSVVATTDPIPTITTTTTTATTTTTITTTTTTIATTTTTTTTTITTLTTTTTTLPTSPTSTAPPPPPTKDGCFIATAAYGSYLDPHVQALRIFRDNVLLQSSWGREFVTFYYKWSPPAARFIAQRPMVKEATQMILTPLVLVVERPLFYGGIFVLGLAITGIVLFRLRRI